MYDRGGKKIIIFGDTGMAGQGVLRECFRDPAVEKVLAVVRKATGLVNEKYRELERGELFDLSLRYNYGACRPRYAQGR